MVLPMEASSTDKPNDLHLLHTGKWYNIIVDLCILGITKPLGISYYLPRNKDSQMHRHLIVGSCHQLVVIFGVVLGVQIT